MKRKLLSIITVICVLCAMLPATSAFAMTAQDGANWAIARIGQSIDTDGYYGAQCKDFINAYCQENWGFTPPGNAIDVISYNYPSGWQKIQNTPDFIPQPGDIAVWTIGTYGHVGIIISANINSFVSVEQNWYNCNGYVGSPAAKVTHNYSSFWGVIRPPFSSAGSEATATQTAASTGVSEGMYNLACAAGGRYMNVYAGWDWDGVNVCVWDADGSPEQKIKLVSRGSGKYALYPSSSSGRVIDANRGNSYSNPLQAGNNIDLWQTNDAPAQEWVFTDRGGGKYTISLAGNPNLVIACDNPWANNGNVTLRAYTGAENQLWYLKKI